MSFVAAFAVGRLFHISGDVSGGGLRGRPWSRPWRGAGFGGSADTEFGGKFVPVAGLRRRRLRSLRRLRPLRRGLLRAGRRRLGRLVGGHRAERFGERSPGIVRIVIRHDAGSLRGGAERRRQPAVRRRPAHAEDTRIPRFAAGSAAKPAGSPDVSGRSGRSVDGRQVTAWAARRRTPGSWSRCRPPRRAAGTGSRGPVANGRRGTRRGSGPRSRRRARSWWLRPCR